MRNLLLLGLVGTVVGCGGSDADGAEAYTWRNLTSARQVADREPHQVHLRYGAGRLRVSPADAPILYQLEMRYAEELFTPIAEYDPTTRVLELGVRAGETGGRGLRMGRLNDAEGASAAVMLTREVPLSLSLEFGAGRADIELGGTTLQRLNVSTGASETRISFVEPTVGTTEAVNIEAGAADLRVSGLGNVRTDRINFQGGVGATVLDFGGAWRHDAMASVQLGIGSLTLRVPREIGVRVNRSSVLSSFSAPEMERQGNSYFSGNWEAAPHRLTIDVSAALGSIDIRWID
jgi:hypothetical protein